MISFEFYETDILELNLGSGRFFIDLADFNSVDFDGDDVPSVPVYSDADPDAVRDLFGAYGMLERCPLDEADSDV